MSSPNISFTQRFANRLTFWVLGIFSIAQLGTMWSVNQTSYESANKVLEQSLSVAETVFLQAYKERSKVLKRSIKVVAADFGFKKAFSSNDQATIASAMGNHMRRLEGADLMMLVSLDNQIIHNTFDRQLNGSACTWTELLEQADDSDSLTAEGVGTLQNKHMQLFVAPLENPDLAAWVIIGFAYNDAFAKQIREIALAEVSLLDTRQPMKLIASSHPAGLKPQLTSTFQPQQSTMLLGKERFLGRSFALSKALPHFTVVIQQSIDQQMASYEALSQRLLLLFLIGLGGFGIAIIWLARSITKPVSTLTLATAAVERGNLNHSLHSSRNDELGQLVRAFDSMIKGLHEKQRIRSLLGKVVSHEIAEELLNNTIDMGGEEKQVTMLFSDIRGFTNTCEGQPPKRILELLNIYLTEMSAIIESHSGVVDKFIGDAIMALYGAPVASDKAPQDAVQTALDMVSSLRKLNLDITARGYQAIDIGIGINTGMVVAGNMGSESRMNYTVIGDEVNLCARLEGLTKFYGVPIIVSANSKQRCSNIAFLYLDHVRVKGKQEAVRIYAPLHEPLPSVEEQKYQAALTLYQKADFTQAAEHFKELWNSHQRSLYQTYEQRCVELAAHPPQDWNGIYRFHSK